MQASADSITQRLRDHGYPSATVFTGFEVNKPARRASVTLEVAPGRRAVIGRIRVVGAEPGGLLAGAEAAGGAAWPAILAGGAVPEPAQPV